MRNANEDRSVLVMRSLPGAGLDCTVKFAKTQKLNSVQDSLKTRNRIYQLRRTESEVRVNDYNSLLLILWKANIDVQFVPESSRALAHC